MHRTITTLSLSLVAMLAVVVARHRVAAQDDDKPPVHKIVARPAAEPVPALRYQLLPTLLELKPGNAALLYSKIFVPRNMNRSKEDSERAEKIYEWLSTPLDQLPRSEVRAALSRDDYELDQVAMAARRDYCDWELPIRDGRPWEIQLPEAQGTRTIARALAARARLAIAEGRYDDAIRDLQTGFAVGRHIAAGPTLVNGLVGVAICTMMLDQVETLMQAPGAPNMYWALMALPRPMIDLRTAMQFEMQWIAFAFPQLNDADAPGRTADQWQRIIAEIQETARGFSAEGKAGWEKGVLAAAAAVKIYPEAKKYLVDQGRSAEDVAAMPVGQVLAIYTRDKFLRLRDDQYKWSFVPYAQRGEGVDRSEEAIQRAAREPDLFHFDAILSAVNAASMATLRLDRRIAALAVLEGLRMHAANNGGQLPERLADVTVAPALADPIAGQPFVYRREGNTAKLDAPDLGRRNPVYDVQHYELTILP
jgi:hypothetical protein